MTTHTDPRWLAWAKQIQALAQAGLTYAQDPYDVERYATLRRIAAEMLAGASDVEIDLVLDLLERQDGYPTPKVDLRGVVFREGEVLLVREQSDGLWTLPGGWADVCESPREGVEREVREETGFEVRATKLLAVYDRSRHGHEPLFPFHVYKLFFRCEITGGEATPGMETSAVRFFAADSLPPLSRSRVLPAQIARMFAHLHHPAWPTDVD